MKFVDLNAQFRAIETEIRAAIDGVLAHGQFIMGPEVRTLEEELAGYCGVKHAVTAASGTDALLMGLMAHRIGPGDAVIAPSFTFVATAEVIQLLGATTVFVDVEEDSFNLDPARLAETVARIHRQGKVRLRGIIPVDLFGLPADYDAIQPIADAHGLFVLADAAQSFGGVRNGKRAGAFGDLAATSFFPAKPLGCYGDGGALFTDDDQLAELARSIRVHGMGANQYDNVRTGITGRMDTIQAAVLSCKLKVFDHELAARRRIADMYTSELDGIHGLTPPPPPPRLRKRLGAVHGHGAPRPARRDTRPPAIPGHPHRGLLPPPPAPPAGLQRSRRRRHQHAGLGKTGGAGVQPAHPPLPERRRADENHRRGESSGVGFVKIR